MNKEFSELGGVWELYGLRTNPFSTSPLLVKGGLIPIESFSGREEELKRLLKIFHSEGGSRTLVCGDVGVGKTTLVNVARYQINLTGFFTPFKEIGVQQDWDANDFILNTIYAIYATIKLLSQKPISDETIKKMQNLVELSSTQTTEVGINVAGFGGNVSKTTKHPKVLTNLALVDFLEELVLELKKSTGKDLVIHYNNLERLKENTLRKIFEDLRDFFQIPNVHFVFVGNLTVHSIFQSMPRFSSIISDMPVILAELSLDEIKEILQIRFEKLRIDEKLNFVVPFTEQSLITLYELYSGNIRNILNSLQTVVIEATNERPVVLDKNSLANILKTIVEKRYLSQIQKKPKELLLEAVKHPEITNKRLSELTGIARSNVSTYTKLLESNGCIYVKRKDGKDKYWSVEPKIKWLLLDAKKLIFTKERKTSKIKEQKKLPEFSEDTIE